MKDFQEQDERVLSMMLGGAVIPESGYRMMREYTRLHHKGGRTGPLPHETLLHIAHQIKHGGQEKPPVKNTTAKKK